MFSLININRSFLVIHANKNHIKSTLIQCCKTKHYNLEEQVNSLIHTQQDRKAAIALGRYWFFCSLHLVKMHVPRGENSDHCFEHCFSIAGSLPVEDRNGLYWFRCRERGVSEKRKTRRLTTLSERKEKVDHTGHKETPTTRASPFYCTQHLFIYSILNQFMFIQIN